ncbi:MAG: ATP-binding protein [Paracoccaceae bacterium]
MLSAFRRYWAKRTLAQRIALAGFPVLVLGMALLGSWVSTRIADGVTRNSAAATATFVESLIAPLLQDLAVSGELANSAIRALDEVFAKDSISARIASLKIWAADGTVLYATETGLIGQTFPPNDALTSAFAGNIYSEFNALDSEESARELMAHSMMIEVYSPVYAVWSGDVIAVVETYEVAETLARELTRARINTWGVVAATGLGMAGLLFGITLNGSRTITAQQGELARRLREVTEVSAQNERLRQRVQAASGRAALLNERFLKRLSADLHDGPAQNLALAALRLDRITPADSPEIAAIRGQLDAAIHAIRALCRGLTLPEIEAMSAGDILARVCEIHTARSDCAVNLNTEGLGTPDLDHAHKTCLHRFVEEALNNGFKHAGGAGQSVRAHMQAGWLHVDVCDAGPGGAQITQASANGGMGLRGLADRIESLGGRFEIRTSPEGTCLHMELETA